MLSLLVLFTVFVGLIGTMVLYNSYRMRAGLRSNKAQALQHLQGWLTMAGVAMPTTNSVLAVLNRQVHGMRGQHEV